MSLKELSRRMIEVLKENNIPFTIHWGKNTDWAFPDLVEHMYGAKAIEWKKHRSALLSKEMANLFSNGFLETANLSAFEENTPVDLIASL